MAPGKVLDAGDGTDDGAALVQRDRTDGRPQRWRIEPDGEGGGFFLTEAASGRVVGNSDSRQDGTDLVLWAKEPGGQPGQKWSVEPPEPTDPTP
ncbi:MULTISPECIES: RICIN domain-containing protein [unclassified Streptomyces]|uniref:RICIN domain-containing protein n=1 Tax=unclassified Streptomyces TaxID=2593676 RepID=UPI00380FCE6B